MKSRIVIGVVCVALLATPALAQYADPAEAPDAGAAVGAAIVGGILGGALGLALGGRHPDRAGLIGHVGGGGAKKGGAPHIGGGKPGGAGQRHRKP